MILTSLFVGQIRKFCVFVEDTKTPFNDLVEYIAKFKAAYAAERAKMQSVQSPRLAYSTPATPLPSRLSILSDSSLEYYSPPVSIMSAPYGYADE